MEKIIILSSGISDLVTAIAALRYSRLWNSDEASQIIAVILGHKISLPEKLLAVFKQTAAQAFRIPRVEAFNWEDDAAAIAQFVAAQPAGCVLASNQLQHSKQRAIIASLRPGKFLFYDNGLSSYHEHNINWETWNSLFSQC